MRDLPDFDNWIAAAVDKHMGAEPTALDRELSQLSEADDAWDDRQDEVNNG